MRVILWVVLGLGVLWAGYWVAGSRAVAGGVTQWFAQAGDQGIEASQSGVAVGGFPNRFDLTVTDPHLRDPATGWGWQAPFAQVFAMTWKPWHVIAALPNDQKIIAPDQVIDLKSDKMQASVRLVPSADLPLAEVVVDGQDLLATSDKGWTVAVKSFVAAMSSDGATAQHLGLNVLDVTPDAALSALLPELGPVITMAHLDATATLTAPLDRHMDQTQPKLGTLKLSEFVMIWGKLTIAASGQVAPDANGLAMGKLQFRLQNWRSVPALMVATGLVLPGMGDTITRGLDMLAKSGKDPEVLEIALVFAEGWMSLGPLPLGPAPVLDQRQ